MKYIVFPVKKLNEVPQEILDELHLVPRKNNNGTEVIMKLSHYELLFPVAALTGLSLSYLRRRRVEYCIVRSGVVIK